MDSLGDLPIIKALILAAAKAGKTTTVGWSATKALGPGYIACASTREHLRGVKDMCEKDGLAPPEFDMIKGVDDMEAALKTMRSGAKDGKYKWAMADDFGLFASSVLEAMVVAHKSDGRKYWDAYTRHVSNVVMRLLDLKIPVFLTMHYMETSAEMDGQVSKSGPGIVPAVQGGLLRQFIPGQFNQVIWMEKRGDQRIFRLSVEGVTGPGCNNVRGEITDIIADVGELLKALSGKPTTPIQGKKK